MKFTILAFLPLLSFASAEPALSTPPAFPGVASQWEGFITHRFPLPSGAVATVVEPWAAPAPGRPWILQGSLFPAADPVIGQVNGPALALLARGWHIAVTDLGNTFGAPSALKKWDELYLVMTGKYHLSRKPILIGVSRDGLPTQRWAAAHLDQVGGIYGDHAVCDFKSWPGGRLGIGAGSPEDWTNLMHLYGFTNEKEALAYKENPVDLAPLLAKARIPILYTVGETDSVVPYKENAGVMEERLNAGGGDVTVIRQAGIGHQPHGLKDPAPIIQFMLRCAQPK